MSLKTVPQTSRQRDAAAFLRFVYGDATARQVLGHPSMSEDRAPDLTLQAAEEHMEMIRREISTGLAASINSVKVLQAVYGILQDPDDTDRIDTASEYIQLARERMLRRFIAPLRDLERSVVERRGL